MLTGLVLGLVIVGILVYTGQTASTSTTEQLTEQSTAELPSPRTRLPLITEDEQEHTDLLQLSQLVTTEELTLQTPTGEVKVIVGSHSITTSPKHIFFMLASDTRLEEFGVFYHSFAKHGQFYIVPVRYTDSKKRSRQADLDFYWREFDLAKKDDRAVIVVGLGILSGKVLQHFAKTDDADRVVLIDPRFPPGKVPPPPKIPGMVLFSPKATTQTLYQITELQKSWESGAFFEMPVNETAGNPLPLKALDHTFLSQQFDTLVNALDQEKGLVDSAANDPQTKADLELARKVHLLATSAVKLRDDVPVSSRTRRPRQ